MAQKKCTNRVIVLRVLSQNNRGLYQTNQYKPRIYKSTALIILNDQIPFTVLVDINEYRQSTSYLYRR